jgi:hypothetical protein
MVERGVRFRPKGNEEPGMRQERRQRAQASNIINSVERKSFVRVYIDRIKASENLESESVAAIGGREKYDELRQLPRLCLSSVFYVALSLTTPNGFSSRWTNEESTTNRWSTIRNVKDPGLFQSHTQMLL